MGKVLKTVAVIAITVAIAAYAPQLAPAFLAHALGTAAASALTAAVLTVAANAAFQALASSPHTSTAPGLQPSRSQPLTQAGLSRSYPPLPTVKVMQPIDEPWWRNRQFMPWQRFAVMPVRGVCMVPVMAKGAKWVVLDRCSPIESGDLFLLKPDDLRDYMRASGGDHRAAGLVKRFIGVDPDRRVVVYETTNPPNRIETGLDRLAHAYRVDSWHAGWLAAMRACVTQGV